MNHLRDVENRYDGFAEDAAVDERISFIRKVYGHLLGATLLFAALCALFLNVPGLAAPLFSILELKYGMLLLLGGFMAASFVAQMMAQSSNSRPVQYAGLGLYVVLQSVIFTPLLFFATLKTGSTDIIAQAGIVTLVIFGGLTAIVMLTKSDFSFLRNFLWIGGLAATALVAISIFTGAGITGSSLFVVAMIVLFSGWILYDTSNIIHHYDSDQYVAASLALFASVTTLFWYVLRLLMDRE